MTCEAPLPDTQPLKAFRDALGYVTYVCTVPRPELSPG